MREVSVLPRPPDSIRLAVFTVSPNRQYRGIFRPTTPATAGPVGVHMRTVLTHITGCTEVYICVLGSHPPECMPIRSCSFCSGMCRMVKERMAERRWRDMEAISPACWSPLRSGSPDTTMSVD